MMDKSFKAKSLDRNCNAKRERNKKVENTEQKLVK